MDGTFEGFAAVNEKFIHGYLVVGKWGRSEGGKSKVEKSESRKVGRSEGRKVGRSEVGKSEDWKVEGLKIQSLKSKSWAV